MSTGLRELVLAALDEFRCPCGVEELGPYLEVFKETTLSRVDMEVLLQQDQRKFLDGASGPILCPVILRMPGFPADRRLLSRSDWDLVNRLVLTSFEATRQLWLLRSLCDLATIALEERREAGLLVEQIDERSRFLLPAGIIEARLELGLSDRPEDAPMTEVQFLRGRLDICREVAEDALLILDDTSAMQGAIEELMQMPMAVQLFGGQLEVHSY